jgi:triacylglycerol esterase/lipase EstA (alpha/beta hydrolase family)
VPRLTRLALAGLASAALVLPAAGAVPGSIAAAAGSTYAPLDRPGPRLDVPAAKLRASLFCGARTWQSDRQVILLIPGTNLDPQSNFGWNYLRAFREYGLPYCTVTLPHHTMGDVQVAGEYVVHAIRAVARRSGRQVDILGYSQGGMLPRWALRWWPDTRKLVDDVVALDPSNHGTLDAQALCQASCPPAYWQQASNAHFYDALNSRAETFAGIDYTVIYSHTDEIVVPNTDASGSSSLHTGNGTITNIAVQDICPNDVSDHLAMGSYDPVGYALAVDAFNHPGVAKPSRIDPTSVCTSSFQPGVDPQTFATDYAQYLGAIGQAAAESPQTSSEPPLACYVYASPPKGCAR